MNYPFFNVFKGFTIFFCQIHLSLEKKYVFTFKSEFFSNFLWIYMFELKTWTIRYSVLVFSLKLHNLPYLNLFIFFNNILKKISFSCYIKCNKNHFKVKLYISLKIRIFLCFFLFISMFWMKIKEKERNILTFHGNSFFSLKIA